MDLENNANCEYVFWPFVIKILLISEFWINPNNHNGLDAGYDACQVLVFIVMEI